MEGYEDLVPKQKTVGDVMSDSYADLVPEKKPSVFEPIKEKIPELIVPPQIKAFTSFPEKYRTAIGKGALGETKKLVGGALDLLPGETGKKLYESGERQVKEAEEISPTATLVGQTGPYLGTYAGIGRGLKALKVPSPTTKLGRVAETAGTAATTGAITTPGGVEERAKEAAAQGSLGGILQAGFEAVPGLVKGARKFIKGEPVGSPTGYVELGERIKSEIPKIAQSKYTARKNEAETLYNKAKDIARTKQEMGNSFAESDAGRSLVNELERSKQYSANGQSFLKGEDYVKAVDNLINKISPLVKGGERIKKELPRGAIYETTPRSTKQKDIEAVIEELRYLRQVNEPGAIERGYNALDANYRREIVDRLEKAIYRWSPEYAQADEAYKLASQKLKPYETNLMRKILNKEKYDPKELAVDTEDFAKKFFSTRDSVKELKSAVENDKFVKDLAADYSATLFQNKTPQQIKSYLADPNNAGWLNEAGIYDATQKYANTMIANESRKDIAKKILKYALIGAGAGAAINFGGVNNPLRMKTPFGDF
jgi:hypothetical protein